MWGEGAVGGMEGLLAQFIHIDVGPGTNFPANAARPGGAFPQMLWVIFIPTMWCAMTDSVLLGSQRLNRNSHFK